MATLDDMLAGKRGFIVLGIGMHHDPMSSFRKVARGNRGHRWIVRSVIVRFPCRADPTFVLPILVRFLGTMTMARIVSRIESRRMIGRAARMVHAPATTGALIPQLVAPYPIAWSFEKPGSCVSTKNLPARRATGLK